MKGQSHPPKSLLIGYLCMGIGILILMVKLAGGVSSGDTNRIPFYIGGSGETTSHVTSNIVKVYFQMDLVNADHKKKMIHSIEPLLHAEADYALPDKNAIKIAREIHIDRTKLSGDDITKHMSFVYVYRVTYDNGQVELVPVTYVSHYEQYGGQR